MDIKAYDTHLAGWNFSWDMTEEAFASVKKLLDDNQKGIRDESEKIIGNVKIGKYGIRIERIGSDPEHPIDLTFYRLTDTDKYANRNNWTEADENYWTSLPAIEIRGADFDTLKRKIEDKIYRHIMTRTGYGKSSEGQQMLKEDILCPIPEITNEKKTSGRSSMLEELEEYAQKAAEEKAKLDADIKKDESALKEQRKRLAKETEMFLLSLRDTCDKIFSGKRPELWPYSKENIWNNGGDDLNAEILPEKTSVSRDSEPTPHAVSVGINDFALHIALYEDELEKAKEPDKTLYVTDYGVQYHRDGKTVDDAFYEDELSIAQMKWILANRNVIEEAFSRTVRIGIDQQLKKTEREKNSVRQNLMNAKAKIPETKKIPGLAEKKSLAAKPEKKVMTEKTYAKLMDAVAWLRGWVEHSEFEGIYPQERKNAAVLLDEMEKLIDRKWEKTKSQEVVKKTIPAQKKEPDYDGYEL